MEITIFVSKEVENILAEKASAKGKDIKTFVEGMIATEATRPTLDEILAPVRRDFAASGMTEDELDELIESERQALWEEKHGKRS
jgi:hypothetical protein